MNENYAKLINAVMPETLMGSIAAKIGTDKEKVEICSAELIAKIFGEGEDLRKNVILDNLKKASTSETLKEIIIKTSLKHEMQTKEVGTILAAIIPIIQTRITSLDATYFESEQKEVKVIKEEKEESVEEVFKNIERKAQEDIKIKEKKPSRFFINKHKIVKQKGIIVAEGQENKVNNNISLIEKICMWVVLAAFVGLVVTVTVLIIVSKTTA